MRSTLSKCDESSGGVSAIEKGGPEPLSCSKVARNNPACGWLKRAEGEDYYDTRTNFTPFSLSD